MTLEENIRQANSDFVSIKEKIVECGVEVAEGTHTREYARKVNEVFEAGKKAEYDSFWDAFLDYGRKTDYYMCFVRAEWNDKTFKPKYDLRPIYCHYMFYFTEVTDLVEALEKQGVVFDTSNAVQINNLFGSAKVTRVGVIDARKAPTLLGLVNYASRLETIDKLILNDLGTTAFDSTFDGCISLKNMVIEGVIGTNGLDIHWSTLLTRNSIENIISCLSTTTSGLSVTLSKTAVNNAFTDTEWATLIATKSNWTINLV